MPPVSPGESASPLPEPEGGEGEAGDLGIFIYIAPLIKVTILMGIGGLPEILNSVLGFMPKLFVAFSIIVAGHLLGRANLLHVLPGLGDEIATSRVMTPLDFREELLSFRGAAFSFEPILRQSAWFRPHNRSEEVEGLYLVGAGTHPGAGVPGVLSSARVLDTVVPDPDALRS